MIARLIGRSIRYFKGDEPNPGVDCFGNGWCDNSNPADEAIREAQRKHLEEVRRTFGGEADCAHNHCPQCHGTGIKLDGTACIHMLVCHCKRCGVVM